MESHEAKRQSLIVNPKGSTITLMKKRFTTVIEKRGRWYVGYVEELPGANTQARTLAKVRANLKEVIQLILQANRELSQNETEAEKVIREQIVLDA